MKSIQSILVAALAAAALTFSGCKKDSPTEPPNPNVGTVELEFEHTVGDSSLVLNTKHYTTPAGDEFTVRNLLYYVSNVTLIRADGSEYRVPESYFLVDQADKDSHHLAMANIPVGDYTRIAFVVGVDSARNLAGAQTGALDPVHGMFWDWDHGYIFLKMEGNSPQAPGAGHDLSYIIHGFRAPTNTLRPVTMTVPNGGKVAVRADHRPEVHVKADLLNMFVSPNPVRFATFPGADGGANAMKVADNYANPAGGMFTIEHVHAN